MTGYGALWGDYDVHARLVMIGLRGGVERAIDLPALTRFNVTCDFGYNYMKTIELKSGCERIA